MTCWLNGQLTDTPLLDATSAGTLLGWGVFTTVGIRASKPLLFDRHIARLKRDAAATRIEFMWSEIDLRDGLNQVIAANRVENGLARLTLTRRDDGRWNTVTGSDLLIAALTTPLTPTTGARLLVSTDQWSAKRPLAGVKTTSYLPYILAWQDARDEGFDEALLLTDEGYLSEGARTSLFWAQAGQLYTPELQSGCLAGIGREWVLEWAQAQHIVVHEGLFPYSHLQTADEVLLISGATGPRSVALVSHPEWRETVDVAAPGPLTHALSDAWREL